MSSFIEASLLTTVDFSGEEIAEEIAYVKSSK
jgi:hypothetical protein